MFYFDPLYPNIVDKYLNSVFDCSDMYPIIKENMLTSMGTACELTARVDYTYYSPPEAGFKIASEPRNAYFVLNLHLENHYDQDAPLFTSGIKLWHTSHLRKNDLEQMIISHTIGKIGFIIPPREPTFAIRSVVDMHCFKHVINL